MNVKILLQKYLSCWIFLSMAILFFQSPSYGHVPLGDKDKIKLDEAFQRIGQKYDVFFNYDQSLTSNIMVEYEEAENATLKNVLSDLLKNTHLEYQIFDDQFVVIFQNSEAGIENLKSMITHVKGFVEEQEEKRRGNNFVQVLQPAKIQKIENKRIVFNISGSVSDEEGEPLIGVNVQIKGSNKGTATDFDGQFVLEDIDENAVLIISYVGYQTLEVPVAGKTHLDIVMISDSQLLDEVVVVGYGTQKKRDLTGAVSSIRMDDSPVNTITTISHALAGKAAGLNVIQNSTQPGGGATFRIRGETSTGAGNEPLIIIDGFPVTNTANLGSGNRYEAGSRDNILESLNPNDIESIEILKDASSTAIYGSRAGHGVIIITTKRGRTQKARINYSGNYSSQSMKNAYKMLTPRQYMEERNRDNYELYLKNNGLDLYADYITLDPGHHVPEFVPRYSQEQINSIRGTDWFDEVTRNGYQQSHNISINGGDESTQFMASLNYTGQNGVMKNNDMERFTTKVNLDHQFSQYVKTGLTMNVSRISNNLVPLGSSNFESAGLLVSALKFNPTIPVFNEDGSYAIDPDLSQMPNPVSLLEISDLDTKDRLMGTGFVEVEPVQGLVLRAMLGADRQYAKRKNYLPKTTMYGRAEGGNANVNQQDDIIYLMDLTANYSRDIDAHSFNALIGYSYQQFNRESMFAGNQDFLLDIFLYNNLGAGAYSKPQVGSGASKNALGSYFARINYSYLGKYLLTSTVRADGASNFHPDHRWGYFPSASVGWRFTEESFMSGLDRTLSEGKLRIGYGQTGNSNVGNRILDNFRQGYNYVFGETGYMGVYAQQLGNPRLTWETTSEFNIGLDLGFLNNRVALSMEYYNRIISDLLVTNKSLLSYNEISSIAANIGKTQGQGFEVTLNSRNITKQDFSWGTDLTFSTYKDRWLERDPDWKPAAYQSEKDYIRSTFTYLSDGLLQPGEAPPAHQPALLPGQVILKDLNGDGKLDDHDRVFIGTSDPSFYFGINNTLQYKNFDLNVHVFGEVGRLRGASYYDAWSEGLLNNAQNMSTGTLRTWHHDRQDTHVPSPIQSDYGVGDYWHKKISYLKFRNITLGYTLPAFENVIERARVYIDVNNPFSISNFADADPETGTSQYHYPNVLGLNFGVNLTF